jgi:DNA mismatch endonuclease (patch repair protein)
LYSKGIRYRVHALLPGKPDLVFPGKKLCVFINGCFWHMHQGCKNFVIPQTNTEFWMNKIQSNVIRDSRNYALLKKEGWKPLIIWECIIERDPVSAAQQILDELTK